MKKKGLIMVLTGDGKGKTTSALGMALRALGHGFKVIMIQFIKGSMRYGELHSVAGLTPAFEIIPLGRGFVHVDPHNPAAEDVDAAREALRVSAEKIQSDSYFMVILDEINNAIDYGLLDVQDVLAMLTSKPPEVNVILTGRGAHPEILSRADLITEMKEIRHHYQQGEKSRKGIEF